MLSGLYYPFSRTINLSSLKQMLLVFEQVCFLDPVSDEAWRAGLFQNLEKQEDARFSSYREVYSSLETLFSEGVAKRIDPAKVELENPLTTASALSDLLDPEWSSLAASPGKYKMPHRRLAPDGGATWQIFMQKMPSAFIDLLESQEQFRRHLIFSGGSRYSWTLSYEAGSAVSMGVHLAAAEELNLAPVTDSKMHHELLLKKLIRNRAHQERRPRPIDGGIAAQLAHSTAATVIESLLSKQQLDQIGVDEILLFREKTRQLRQQMVIDISDRFSLLSKVPDFDDLLLAGREVQQEIRSELRSYSAEMNSVKGKVWPNLISSTSVGLASGSIASAVAMNFIAGPGYTLLASVLAGSMALLKGALDLRLEREKLKVSSSPVVSYLTQLSDFGR